MADQLRGRGVPPKEPPTGPPVGPPSDSHRSVPHPIPYQGSKRRLAAAILARAPRRVDRLIEPFVGSAALTLAAANRDLAARYVMADKLLPLVALWRAMLTTPDALAAAYTRVWSAQLDDPPSHYLEVRDRFNRQGQPEDLLFLLARCVKNAVRFNADGHFNQSADHRRKGMHPTRMTRAIQHAAKLLGGRATVAGADYSEAVADAGPTDLVYLDPPYQGVSGARDSRYIAKLDLQRFIVELESMNRRGVPYLLSFDGRCGERVYGEPLPAHLGLVRVELSAGRSTQATLLGRDDRTVESLYVSPALQRQRTRA